MKKARCTLKQALEVRNARMKALETGGYRSIGLDAAGQIVVEVHADRYSNRELFRRAWGPDWPVVRSGGFDPRNEPAKQFEFYSRGFAVTAPGIGEKL